MLVLAGVFKLKYQTIQLRYPISGPHQEHRNKRVKKDTLFKDQEPQKPYPIPQHVPIQPIYGSTPPPPPPPGPCLKVMLHGTIHNDDFQRNTALQCWNNVVTICNNVATMLPHCVVLQIIVANHLMQHHLQVGFIHPWSN